MRAALLAAILATTGSAAEAASASSPKEPLGSGLPSRFEGKKLEWDPRFTRVDAVQVTVTIVAASVALAANILKPRPSTWSSSGTSFDDEVRGALRLETYNGRTRARDATDVLVGGMSAFPFIVDSLMIAYWYRGSADAARQMFLIDAEAMAIGAAVQGTVAFVTGRERPYGRDCGSAGVPSDTIECNSSSRHRSFFSGHTSQAFTSAALICAHHLALDLFDSSADGITCALAMTAATATGLLRVVGDMHYATDVLVAAAVGTTIGFGVPWLHHYRRRHDGAAVEVRIVPTFGGLAAIGGF